MISNISVNLANETVDGIAFNKIAIPYALQLSGDSELIIVVDVFYHTPARDWKELNHRVSMSVTKDTIWKFDGTKFIAKYEAEVTPVTALYDHETLSLRYSRDGVFVDFYKDANGDYILNPNWDSLPFEYQVWIQKLDQQVVIPTELTNWILLWDSLGRFKKV